MLYTLLRRTALLALATVAGSAAAAVVTFSGNVGDPTNTALVAYDLSPALFAGDVDKANNVALYALHVPLGGSVGFTSTGYAAGGIDPYFTLFRGTNPATATFVDSNYFQAVAGDFTQAATLAAGDYTVAIGVFANLSFAENYGVGVLADGFIGVGGPAALGNGSYTLTVTLPDTTTPVPEPEGAVLALTALLAALSASRRRRQAQTPHGGR